MHKAKQIWATSVAHADEEGGLHSLHQTLSGLTMPQIQTQTPSLSLFLAASLPDLSARFCHRKLQRILWPLSTSCYVAGWPTDSLIPQILKGRAEMIDMATGGSRAWCFGRSWPQSVGVSPCYVSGWFGTEQERLAFSGRKVIKPECIWNTQQPQRAASTQPGSRKSSQPGKRHDLFC